jgi:hypothetical protein
MMSTLLNKIYNQAVKALLFHRLEVWEDVTYVASKRLLLSQ